MPETAMSRLFPGSNTAAGFVGFFENLRAQADRTVILKGGPGVGKSTLMRRAAEQLSQQGHPVVCYPCSGDPDSLDAVFAPDVSFLILDGTAPHIVDPRCPGARDGILNLGVCLDEKQLAAQAPEIEGINAAIRACYAQAYRYLRAALEIRRDAAAVYDAALPGPARRKLEQALASHLPKAPEGPETHAFAQAITWKGVMQEMDAVLTDTVVCLDVPWGFDAHALLLPLWRTAEQTGLARAAYHDPLDASSLAHVTLGGAAFTTAVMLDAPAYAPAFDQAALRRESARLSFDRAVYDLCVNQAVESLAAAKQQHDTLERYYIDAMDYARLDEMQKAFLASLPRG